MTSNHVLDLGGAFPAGTYAILAKAGIAADGGKTVVTVTVTLLREHAVKKDGKDAPVNGRLRLCLYDAATKTP